MTAELRASLYVLVSVLAACGAPSSSTEPATEDNAATSTPAATAEPAPVATPAPAQPEPESEPKGSCQRYLELYEKCEPRLQADIQAGNRRSFRAEQARLDYIAKTPEVAGLADACASWLPELEKACS
ncbi:MAG: hypothetical protein HOV80_30025 [Polyangiaceae bacterium]|nr:hypothetical protein [Polyangiaceae bacterium]